MSRRHDLSATSLIGGESAEERNGWKPALRRDGLRHADLNGKVCASLCQIILRGFGQLIVFHSGFAGEQDYQRVNSQRGAEWNVEKFKE